MNQLTCVCFCTAFVIIVLKAGVKLTGDLKATVIVVVNVVIEALPKVITRTHTHTYTRYREGHGSRSRIVCGKFHQFLGNVPVLFSLPRVYSTHKRTGMLLVTAMGETIDSH
jgi:hypothetical protein